MNVERMNLTPRWIVGVRHVVAIAELRTVFSPALATAAAGLAAQGLTPTGPAMALYRQTAPDKVEVVIGFSVEQSVMPGEDLVCEALPTGPAVCTVHSGPYEDLEATYGELTRWMLAEGLVASPVMWEEYLAGPGNEPDPARWLTRVVFPLATT